MEIIKEYIYFFSGLLTIPIWLWYFIRNKDSRKEILQAGIIFGIFSVIISYYFSQVDYWNPKFILKNLLIDLKPIL